MTIVNKAGLAEVTGWALSTITARATKGMPYLEKPDSPAGAKEWKFDTVAVIEWATEGSEAAPDPMKDANLRDKVAGATLKELDIAERVKQLIRGDESVEIGEESRAIAKSRLNAIPGRVAQRLSVESDPAVILRILTEEIEQTLELLHADYSKLLKVE